MGLRAIRRAQYARPRQPSSPGRPLLLPTRVSVPRATDCHRHPIAKESLDVMTAVEDTLRGRDENFGTNAEFNRGRMFGGAVRRIGAGVLGR